jgi:predicted unusual protein kinase regulating ubiquinone biosynthesis (AarF/ABC1/UbiB family)
MNYVDSDIETRNQIALNMFKAWYVPLYHYGIIHGDPHLGNYTVRDDLSINLLDFGCVRIFPPKFVQGVITLYNALMTKNDDLAVEAYESWGFHDLSKAHIETLNIWAGFLYGPLMEDKIRPIGEVSNGVYGRETAEKVHERLRDLGGITVPREFVFMDRAALGLGSVFLHLKAEVNWYRVFNEMIDGFDMANLQTSQDDALALFDIDNKYTTAA